MAINKNNALCFLSAVLLALSPALALAADESGSGTTTATGSTTSSTTSSTTGGAPASANPSGTAAAPDTAGGPTAGAAGGGTTGSGTPTTSPAGTGTASSAAPANQPIPTWLKDYEPKSRPDFDASSMVKPATALLAPKPVPQKQLKLFGRLEEISGNGAVLPVKIKLQSQKPVLDPRGKPLTASASAGAQQGLVSSFPVDFAGAWSGKMKIHGVQFDPIRWQFDPAEANKERQLMTPGTMGDVTFNFFSTNGRVGLQPTEVIFTSTMDAAQANQMMGNMFGGAAGNSQMGNLFGGSGGMAAMMRNMPYQFAMHLGDLTQGRGVTGNQLQSRLVKNDVRQLNPGVLEQEVVSYSNDYNPQTKKTRYFWEESVLRFTKLSANQLYVQAACVNYRQDGKFENKYLLYGTMNRATAAAPGYPGGFGGGFPAMPAGGGNMGGALDQLIRQLNGGR